MNGANQCPLLTEDRLCRIQAELGEELLSHACATYPRIVNSIGGIEETALSLSCPEAARLVLLNPDLLTPARWRRLNRSGFRARSAASAARRLHLASALVLAHPAACAGPGPQSRLPALAKAVSAGLLCRRLDSIAKGELQRSVPAFLGDFEATVASGALPTAMEALPLDRAAQLDVVLRLAGMLLHRSNVRPRFVECVQAFTAGIGNGPGATLETSRPLRPGARPLLCALL